MKKRTLLTLAIASLVTFSCNKATVSQVTPAEIDIYIAQNPELPDFDKQCLLNGQVQLGIQAETLRLMLGEPREIVYVQKAWGPQQNWLYRNGGKRTFIIEDGGVVGIEEEN